MDVHAGVEPEDRAVDDVGDSVDDVGGRPAEHAGDALAAGEVRVFLNEERAWQGILGVNPIALRDGDERLVAERLCAVLGAVRPLLDAAARR